MDCYVEATVETIELGEHKDITTTVFFVPELPFPEN